MNNKEVANELKKFHKRILETNLASKIYEQEVIAIVDAIDLLEDELNIDDELYELRQVKNYKTDKTTYEIYYGYVSTLRTDKNNKKHFRYTYFNYNDPDKLNPVKRDKSEKFKSVHEASFDELYMEDGKFEGKIYFRELADAQEAVRLLKSENHE